jgi:hypothetical protein
MTWENPENVRELIKYVDAKGYQADANLKLIYEQIYKLSEEDLNKFITEVIVPKFRECAHSELQRRHSKALLESTSSMEKQTKDIIKITDRLVALSVTTERFTKGLLWLTGLLLIFGILTLGVDIYRGHNETIEHAGDKRELNDKLDNIISIIKNMRINDKENEKDKNKAIKK